MQAPKSGKIKKIWAKVGDVVDGDQKILEFYQTLHPPLPSPSNYDLHLGVVGYPPPRSNFKRCSWEVSSKIRLGLSEPYSTLENSYFNILRNNTFSIKQQEFHINSFYFKGFSAGSNLMGKLLKVDLLRFLNLDLTAIRYYISSTELRISLNYSPFRVKNLHNSLNF